MLPCKMCTLKGTLLTLGSSSCDAQNCGGCVTVLVGGASLRGRLCWLSGQMAEPGYLLMLVNYQVRAVGLAAL